MYIFSLKQTQLSLESGSYTTLRKLIDANMRLTFKWVIYGALITNLLLVIVTIKTPGCLLFITSSIALITLLADTILTVKGNLPVNDIINSWCVDNRPADCSTYRTKWLTIFQYRQIANITGFISLLIGAVFGAK